MTDELRVAQETALVKRLQGATGPEWFLTKLMGTPGPEDTAQLIAELVERRAPGHISPIQVTILVTGRYTEQIESQMEQTIRRLGRPIVQESLEETDENIGQT